MSPSSSPSQPATVPAPQKSLKVSICICTYNGSSRLRPVLEALAQQTAPPESWELLIIDNASTDDTASMAAAFLAPRFGDRARIVHESRPGLSYARHRGGQEARYDIVCFLDDDNVAAPDFVEMIPRAFARYPKSGVIGSQVIPDWQAPPTPLATTVAPYALAICEMGDQPVLFEWVGNGPVGAGMCIRRELLLAACEDPDFCESVTDRKGNSLISGGDMALSIYAAQAGYERRYEPSMVIRHQLPPGRMEKSYLLRLYEGIGRGQACTRRLHARRGRSRLISAFIAAKDGVLLLSNRFRPPQTVLPVPTDPAILRDLRELEHRLILGRMQEALSYALRRPSPPPVSAPSVKPLP